MKRHAIYGVEAPELGWLPMPRYLLRRDRVLHHLGPGAGRKVLDIGCGAGALLADLGARGFHCTGLEAAPKAREIARLINASCPATTITGEPAPDWPGRFDVLMSFEVLEHIPDDHAAMMEWVAWLKPGGIFIASVPCHMSKWSLSDEWAGHVRRYEEDELRKLFISNGLEVIGLESYGYPLANAISILRKRHHAKALRREPEDSARDPSQRTAESGVNRSDMGGFYRLCRSLPGVAVMLGAMQLQKAFLRGRRGDGFLILARRR